MARRSIASFSLFSCPKQNTTPTIFLTLERFLSPDPLHYDAGANFYAYVHANPITLLDPTGLYCGTVGIGHGIGKFAYDMTTFLPRVGFYAGTYCILSRSSRQRTWQRFDTLKQGFVSHMDSYVQHFFRVNSTDSVYSGARDITQLGLETLSIATEAIGLAKGIQKRVYRNFGACS